MGSSMAFKSRSDNFRADSLMEAIEEDFLPGIIGNKEKGKDNKLKLS